MKIYIILEHIFAEAYGYYYLPEKPGGNPIRIVKSQARAQKIVNELNIDTIIRTDLASYSHDLDDMLINIDPFYRYVEDSPFIPDVYSWQTWRIDDLDIPRSSKETLASFFTPMFYSYVSMYFFPYFNEGDPIDTTDISIDRFKEIEL